METQAIRINLNPIQLNSITAFANSSGRLSGSCLDVYFLRYIGFSDESHYLDEVTAMDTLLSRRQAEAGVGYLRVSGLDGVLRPGRAEKFSAMYDVWAERQQEKTLNSEKKVFPFEFVNDSRRLTLEKSYSEIMSLFRKERKNTTPTIEKNFGVKLLHWMDLYFPQLFLQTEQPDVLPKMVYCGDIKIQEYLFLCLLALVGCSVLYLNPAGDVVFNSSDIYEFSVLCRERQIGQIGIPNFMGQSNPPLDRSNSGDGIKVLESGKFGSANRALAGVPSEVPAGAAGGPVSDNVGSGPAPGESQRPAGINPVHPRRGRTIVTNSGGAAAAVGTETIPSPVPGGIRPAEGVTAQRGRQGISRPSGAFEGDNRPSSQSGNVGRIMNYEELAALSGSVVMINIYDNKGTCFKTGSGVLISEEGYILTNFHVVSEGAWYGVCLEDEEKMYQTDELIKYNQLLDLAILKIGLHKTPIAIYRGEKELVRGQKVVAIGSPLGLFNSFSDGIISGFREIDDIRMIQFTAPTSQGSSGGALLDMHGNLIGIITAGYSSGQNLNLAVDYRTFFPFIRGFIR